MRNSLIFLRSLVRNLRSLSRSPKSACFAEFWQHHVHGSKRTVAKRQHVTRKTLNNCKTRGLAFLLILSGATSIVNADDWMFRPSYYSHPPAYGEMPSYPLPESRSAYRPAYYPEAFNFRSAYRINNYVLRNGPRTDRTLYQEGYFQFPY